MCCLLHPWLDMSALLVLAFRKWESLPLSLSKYSNGISRSAPCPDVPCVLVGTVTETEFHHRRRRQSSLRKGSAQCDLGKFHWFCLMLKKDGVPRTERELGFTCCLSTSSYCVLLKPPLNFTICCCAFLLESGKCPAQLLPLCSHLWGRIGGGKRGQQDFPESSVRWDKVTPRSCAALRSLPSCHWKDAFSEEQT